MSDTSETQLDSLTSILRGGSVFTLGTFVARALGFVLTLLLTRAVGSTGYGVYVFAKKLIRVSAGFADLGADKAVLRFVPKYADDPERRDAVLGLGLVTSLVVGVAFGVGLAVAAPWIDAHTLSHPVFEDALRVFAVVLPFYSLRRVLTATFRSLERLEYTVGVNKVAFPAGQVIAVGVALLVGASVVGVVAALVVTGVLLLGVAVAVLYARTDLRPQLDGARDVSGEYYRYSLPLTASRAGTLIYSNVDVLMLGALVTAADVGVYNVALALTSLLALPLMATNQVFPPVASRLYEEDNYADLEGIYGFVTRWTFGLSLLAAAALVVFRVPVLALFGPEFTTGATVLVVLAVSKLLQVAVGPSGYLLMMTDHQYLNVCNQMATAVLNAALNYVLILEFGVFGAAVATAASTAVVNVARLAQVWHFEGLTPYSLKYVKPVAAVGYATVTMVGVRAVLAARLPGPVVIVAGGLAGCAVFAGALWAVGIDSTDREFLDRTLSRTGD